MLVAGKEELNFEDLQSRQQFFVKAIPGSFITGKKKSSTKNRQLVIDRSVFNYFAIDNAGQTADSKHTCSMIFLFFLLASKTNEPLRDDTFQNQSVNLIC